MVGSQDDPGNGFQISATMFGDENIWWALLAEEKRLIIYDEIDIVGDNIDGSLLNYLFLSESKSSMSNIVNTGNSGLGLEKFFRFFIFCLQVVKWFSCVRLVCLVLILLKWTGQIKFFFLLPARWHHHHSSEKNDRVALYEKCLFFLTMLSPSYLQHW